MAERESGYCTGCGWHFKRGHRKYCWRMMTMALDVEPTPNRINRLLREMSYYDRIKSLFYSRERHMYYRYPDRLMDNPQEPRE